jgi:hypothetical protein
MPQDGKFWYISWLFGIVIAILAFLMSILVFLLPVWYIFSILVRCGKINLATLLS